MKKAYLIFCISFISAFCSNAQNCLITAGNSFSNSDGSISYSVGQIIISSVKNDYGTLSHGIQQPYIDGILSDISENKENNTFLTDYDTASSGIRIFSNPTHSEGIIQLNTFEKNLFYNIYDLKGLLIRKGSIISNKTNIPLKSGFYIFTIIKNGNIMIKSQMIKL
ncbi:T9SS type A sorting domain-containing protein [Coprobacter secundus]|uniref:T9SS type A sorting domain-containing protein n=1 Tax=Coprobacter secundus TaxID=1501392 RepID=UPI0023F8E35A|nr:T9SS type A sorting domain-containing protein [Coprobacter secundus]